MERKSIYIFATDSYYTEGHSEIQAFGDDARPQIHVAFADELRTVQLTRNGCHYAPMEKGLLFICGGLYPTTEGDGFYATSYKVIIGRQLNAVVPIELLVIGEASGAEEAEQGKPFVGRSGKMLDQWLKLINIDNYVITNVVKNRPTPSLEHAYPQFMPAGLSRAGTGEVH